jgi:hypothetical protein
MQQRGIEEVILVGNHDCFLKHTNDINSIEELYRGVEGISLIKEPQEFLVHTTPLLLLPWINDNNRDRSLDLIRTSACEVVLGHLELAGFQMYRGQHGRRRLEPAIVRPLRSGDVRTLPSQEQKGPVHYLGAPYPMIWSDYQDARGFHILDLETRQLEFIENPYSIFYRLVYDDAGRTFNYIEKMVEEIAAPDSPYHEAYIKVVVRQKTQPYWFDLMMDALYRVNALDVVIVDDIVVNDDGTETRTEDDLTTVDTLAVMTDFVDNLTINCDKNQLTLYLRDLYNEALAANQSARLS